MANKRKRDDLSDSDSDEITPGKQVLPVANLPNSFDQEPQDGMQYLFLVRRDARRLPHITRVRNPYNVPEAEIVPTSTPLASSGLPCQEWRVAFQIHFSNLRKNLTQATIYVGHAHSSSAQRIIPEKKDRDAWWKFLAGYPESAWGPRNRTTKPGPSRRIRAFTDPGEVVHSRDACRVPPDVQSGNEPSIARLSLPGLPQNVPRQPSSIDTLRSAESSSSAPFAVDILMLSEKVEEEQVEQLSPPTITPSHLREIDHRMSMHLLMYFSHWINVHLQNPSDPLTIISVSHGQWIFALLTKIEDQLSADEMHLLRNLARACLRFIQGQKDKNGAAPADVSRPAVVANARSMSEASCWIVFTAIAGHWGQRDLWADAENALANV